MTVPYIYCEPIFVCCDHPEVLLENVRTIRPDIARPQGVKVVGECYECRAKRREKKISLLSYGCEWSGDGEQS